MIDYAANLDDIDLDNPANPYCGLNRGLVAWWKCLPGRAGGSRWWDLLKRNPGVLTNMGSGSGWGGSPAPGGMAGSMRFDGSNDTVFAANAPSINFAATNAFTMSFWYNPASTGAGAKYIVDKQSTATNFKGYYVYRSARTLNVGLPNGSLWNEQTTGSVLNANTWQFIQISYKAGAFAVYVNGVSVLSNSSSVVLVDSINGITIGGYGGASLYETMSFDDLRLRSRALSAAEVAWEYRDSLLGCPETLNRLGGLTAAQQAAYAAYFRILQQNIGAAT